MKKKKYGWPRRCLSLMCVLVLISMIILQSVPVTYASSEAEAFTSEPEENSQTISTAERPTDDNAKTGNQLVDSIFADGNSDTLSELPADDNSGMLSNSSVEGIQDRTSEIISGSQEEENSGIPQNPSSEPEQDANSGITDNQQDELTSGEDRAEEKTDSEQLDSESNTNPQQENEEIWKDSIATAVLTGDYAKDITAIARTQIGVQENKDNFITAEDGIVHYYSRYGQWAGDAYEEWSAAFISFCAHYANIPQQYLPKSEKASQWAELLSSMYGLKKDDYSPKEGDLIFFQINLHADGNSQIQTETPAHTGIVTGADDQYVYTIEGNCGGEVKSQQYEFGDLQIYGYLNMDEVKKAAGLFQEEPQPGEELTPTPEESQSTEELTPTPESQPTEELTPTPESKEEITRYDYHSDEVNVKVTLTNPEDLPDDTELIVTPTEISQEVQDQITEEAVKEKKAIEKIYSYDIKFMADDKEVQPGNTVKVEVSFPENNPEKEFTVYHVDEEENVENMDGSVNEDGNIEFDTTHFSTYVIVQTGQDKIKVRIEHYRYDSENIDNSTKIYTDDEQELEIGQSLKYAKADNWDVAAVKIITDDENEVTRMNPPEKLELAQNATIKVYYTSKSTTAVGDVAFYDYTVKADGHSFNELGEDAQNNQKLTAGEASNRQNYEQFQYSFADTNGNQPNVWTGTGGGAVTGIVSGINADGSVAFNYPEPGFFENSDAKVSISGNDRYLRKVYSDDYSIVFDKQGDTYTLSGINDKASGNQVAGHGADFFPLDSVSYEEDGITTKKELGIDNTTTKHNYYFGMRYDIDFTIGDYIGDLNYNFTGDDDLWVILDKTQVVIDLGGIHDGLSGSVDLWTKLYDGKYKDAADRNLSKEEKAQEHTLTVLYMERGAGRSNCEMNFTIPHATVSSVTTDPLGMLSFQKINTQEQGLNDAEFTLFSDAACTQQIATRNSVRRGETDGIVIFDRLRAGTYYMKETSAPAGYEESKEVWKVVAVRDGDTVTVTLKDSQDKEIKKADENSDYIQIFNYTSEEILKSNVDYSKTAAVENWDDRTYRIKISASSKMTSTSTTTTGGVADIELVLDASGSMGYGQDSSSTGTVGYTEVSSSNLDKNKVYYYREQYGWRNYYPMINIDGQWMYYTDKWNNITPGNRDNIYEWPSRMDALKVYVNQFIRDTAVKSPDSKIGVNVFSSEGYGDHGEKQSLIRTGDSEATLIKFVSELRANGGTDPGVGLKAAYTELKDAKDNGDTLPKYVVLFTDGEPTGSGNTWNTNAQKTAESQAQELKKAGVKVYTIGFALSEQAKTFLKGGTYNQTEYPGIAYDKNCAFEVDDAAGLGEIFKQIQQTITDNIDITGTTITDVVDNRFVILDDDGKVITDEQLADEKNVTLNNGGVVSADANGTQRVTWSDVTISHDGVSREITVKARDSFAGGNNITTNISPDSKISTGYGDLILPQPKVNVNTKLILQNTEVTIYKGDSVPADEQIIKNFLMGGTTSYEKGTIGGDDLRNVNLTWYKDAGCQETTTLEEIAQNHPDSDVKYYVKAIYNTGIPSEESTKNTDNNIDGMLAEDGSNYYMEVVNKETDENDNPLPYGIYKVNVISGTIKIKKTVSEGATKKADQLFTFHVKRVIASKDETTGKITYSPMIDNDGSEIIYPVEIKIPKGNTEGIGEVKVNPDSEDYGSLSRGFYLVEEVDQADYSVQSITIEMPTEDQAGTDCQNEKSDENCTAVFGMGYSISENNVISSDYKHLGGGQLGVVSFKNEKVTGNWAIKKMSASTTPIELANAVFELKKVSDSNAETRVYYGKSSETGVVSWYEDEDCKTQYNAQIPKGTYTLKEIKAPGGYALSTEVWTLEITKNGKLKSISSSTGETIDQTKTDLNDRKVTFYSYKDKALYTLPSSGGNGIYMFVLSGAAFMATALLLLINNKRKEDKALR